MELVGANCYNGDDTNLPVLRLKLSTGESLEADRHHNTISDHFDVLSLIVSLSRRRQLNDTEVGLYQGPRWILNPPL